MVLFTCLGLSQQVAAMRAEIHRMAQNARSFNMPGSKAYTQAKVMEEHMAEAISETECVPLLAFPVRGCGVHANSGGRRRYIESAEVPAALKPHDEWDGTGVTSEADGAAGGEPHATCDNCERSFPANSIAVFPRIGAKEGGGKSLCGYCSVGRRAQVWWEDDRQWYGGVLDGYNALCNLHRILYVCCFAGAPDSLCGVVLTSSVFAWTCHRYDDGEWEFIAVPEQRIRLAEGDCNDPGPSDGIATSAGTAASADGSRAGKPSQPKRRRKGKYSHRKQHGRRGHRK